MSHRSVDSETCDQCGFATETVREGWGWEEDATEPAPTEPSRWLCVSGVLTDDGKHRSKDFCGKACLKAFVEAL
jgi:hypothetical protein